MKFRTILADPPWNEKGGGEIKRGADRHYPLMKLPSIIALPVKAVVADNAHCYLWITNTYLMDGKDVLNAWGFRYVTCITWGKDRFGLGQYFRGQTEHCLFGVRGNLPYKTLGDGKRAQSTTLLTCPRGEHSRKPEEMRERIERVSCGPFLEMFARPEPAGLFPPREGWTYIGAGATGRDIADDLRLALEA